MRRELATLIAIVTGGGRDAQQLDPTKTFTDLQHARQQAVKDWRQVGNMSGEGNSYRDVTKALEQGNYLVTNEDGTKSTDFDGKPIRDTIDSIMRRSSVQNEWVKEYLREKINQTQASYAIDYTKKKYSNRQKMCNKIIDTLNEIIGGEN